jgi:hypothetical protein
VSKRLAAVDEVKLKSQQPMMGALVHDETSAVLLNCPNNRQHMSERELLMHHLHPELDPDIFCVLPLASREPNITAAYRTHNFLLDLSDNQGWDYNMPIFKGICIRKSPQFYLERQGKCPISTLAS